MKNELLKRILSSVALIAIAFFFIVNGSIFFNFFILAVLTITLYEWHFLSLKKIYYLPGFIFIIFSLYTCYFLRSESDYKITLALAGFAENDINAEVKDGILSIKAAKNNDNQNSSYIHRGIAERSFSRQFRLADNIEVTNAELVNGMLIISLHRNIPEAELPKQIEIKTPSKKILSKKAA